MSNSNASVKHWDAKSANFVLLSQKVGVEATLMWQILQNCMYDCSLGMIEKTATAAEPSLRPWDSDIRNFVLISADLGLHAALIKDLLQLYRISCSLELVEDTITSAGFMIWAPT